MEKCPNRTIWAPSLGKGGEVEASVFRRKQNDLFISQTHIIPVPVLDAQKEKLFCALLFILKKTERLREE